MGEPDRSARRTRTVLVIAVLAAATLLAYWPVLDCGFVNYDDDDYVTENHHVARGLRQESVRWAFTHFHVANWHPLTWLSHMLDVELFGLDPAGHHAVNVVLHLASAVLLLVWLHRCTARFWPAAAVAFLFALHPLRVESVAWIAERKDVLSGLFWMLTLLAYAAYARRPSPWRYALVFGGMALGLMAKPMVITLPFVLLLLDWWPLGRIAGGGAGGEARASLRFLIAEKLPLLALSAASALVALASQSAGGAVDVDLSLPARVGNALVSYVAYLGLMLWPADLAVLYPHPRGGLPAWQVWASAAVLLVVTAAVLRAGAARARGYLPVGWLWYVGTLVPVIGVVQIGRQAMADRYTYLPSIGITALVVFGAAELAARRRLPRAAVAAAAVAVCLGCLLATRHQVRFWKDDLTLCERALAVTRDNWAMHTNYGAALHQAGRLQEAIEQFRTVLRAQPADDKAHNNLGYALLDLGRVADAQRHFRLAIRHNPRHATAHANLARTLAQQGEHAEAVEHYAAALAVEPYRAPVHVNMGVSLRQLGRPDEAIAAYREALRLDPRLARAHHNWGNLLLERGEPEQAAAHFEAALRIDPQLGAAREGLQRARAGRK